LADLIKNQCPIEPKEDEKFRASKAKEILKDVVVSYVHNENYDSAMCKKFATTMCDIIQEKLKDLNYPRYKYVVQVYFTIACQSTDSTCHLSTQIILIYIHVYFTQETQQKQWH
jgi:hypothetical protein